VSTEGNAWRRSSDTPRAHPIDNAGNNFGVPGKNPQADVALGALPETRLRLVKEIS